MLSSLLCWCGIHTGKWSAPRVSKNWETTPSGVVTVFHWKAQERYCAECNNWEEKKTATGRECWQPWSASYAKNVADLSK